MRKSHSVLIAASLICLLVSPALCLIDINTASQSELESLPGVGPSTAKKIIDGRPYRSINDITRVKGIGNKTFAKFKDQITCGSEKGEEEKSAAASPPAKEVPVYSMEKEQLIKCWKCKNICRVSSELKSGWCPYCDSPWAVK